MQDVKLISSFVFTQFLTILGLINKVDVTFYLGATGSCLLIIYYCIKIYREFKELNK